MALPAHRGSSPGVRLPDSARVVEDYGKLPLAFERNQGQTDARVRYVARGPGYSVFLTPTEAVLSVANPPGIVRMKLVDGNPAPAISGVGELPGKSHYFIGNDPSRWRTDIAHYGRVTYRDVYPGVDLVYHGSQGRLEYDFVVSPGANPRQIRLHLDGPEAVRVDDGGNLVLQMLEGRLVQHAPLIYQDLEGGRRWVAGSYVLQDGGDVGFDVHAYDKEHPLVIDPVLEYSTYLGGGNVDQCQAIAVDGSGSAYVTGQTGSTDFPMLNPFQTDPNPGDDVFVTKLSPSGSSLVYSTYLGGGSGETGWGIAVDSAGSAYVTGDTTSTDFPTLNPFQTDQFGTDAFVTKLCPQARASCTRPTLAAVGSTTAGPSPSTARGAPT